jgi:hypothetical protein
VTIQGQLPPLYAEQDLRTSGLINRLTGTVNLPHFAREPLKEQHPSPECPTGK